MVAFKVLIADDDMTNRKLLSSILKKHLYQVETFEACNGIEALDICKREDNLNLILLDIEMPVIDGIEFLKQYRMNSNFVHAPIIAISSNDLSKKHAFFAGVDDFLVKPITEERLLSSILSSSISLS